MVYYYFTVNLPNFNNPLVARGSEQKKGDRSRSIYYHFFLIAIGFILWYPFLDTKKEKKEHFFMINEYPKMILEFP